MSFDIRQDSLVSKRDFIRVSGVSRPTLNKKLDEDPDSPKPKKTPLGDMYLASDINKWLSRYEPTMRNSCPLQAAAMQALAG
ncbi:hypothetical protein [Pseudoalteromonas aurantia]|uniref:AlpA family phage regulatory protein n=1 Tax=Pseudoalteromonas aurantia TaxID=43654 RepID=A0A5S3VAQ7_9GAMM|nr:hypothetical protein [Pseudoalteromonas aurantia]TMO69010.1 hypothetical protein CWC19_06960 [Pseudoalteromonas aurantia]